MRRSARVAVSVAHAPTSEPRLEEGHCWRSSSLRSPRGRCASCVSVAIQMCAAFASGVCRFAAMVLAWLRHFRAASSLRPSQSTSVLASSRSTHAWAFVRWRERSMRVAALGVNGGPACLGVRCRQCGRRGRPRSVPHSAHRGFASRCPVSRSRRVVCHKDRGVALAWRRAARPLSRQEHSSSHSIKKESQPRRGRPKSRTHALAIRPKMPSRVDKHLLR